MKRTKLIGSEVVRLLRFLDQLPEEAERARAKFAELYSVSTKDAFVKGSLDYWSAVVSGLLWAKKRAEQSFKFSSEETSPE